jgi:hypothetical protein
MRQQFSDLHFTRAAVTILTLCLALLAGACASKTTVSSSWADKSQKGAKFERIVVVAVSDNADRRLSFEDAVVYDLRSETTRAWSSTRHMESTAEINEANLRALVADLEADAIVVTSVTSMDVKAVEKGGRTDVIENQQDTGVGVGAGVAPNSNFNSPQRPVSVYGFNFSETAEPVYVTSEYTTVLTTDVYSAASGENLYTVVSTANKQESLTDVIDVLSDVIAARLRSDGVIR